MKKTLGDYLIYLPTIIIPAFEIMVLFAFFEPQTIKWRAIAGSVTGIISFMGYCLVRGKTWEREPTCDMGARDRTQAVRSILSPSEAIQNSFFVVIESIVYAFIMKGVFWVLCYCTDRLFKINALHFYNYLNFVMFDLILIELGVIFCFYMKSCPPSADYTYHTKYRDEDEWYFH